MVNNGSNVNSLITNQKKLKITVHKVLCFSNQNGPPPEIRSKRRKSRERGPPVNNGTKRHFYKTHETAMYKINCKNQYKVHFGLRQKSSGNRPIFETPFFGTPPGARDIRPEVPIQKKPNLEPLTRRVFGNNENEQTKHESGGRTRKQMQWFITPKDIVHYI